MVIISITGAQGRVGRLTVAALAKSGAQLRLVDRTGAGDGGAHDQIQGDLDDLAVCASTVRGADTLIHLAALPNPSAGISAVMATNFAVTLRLVQEAERAGVRRLIYASSVHAMGLYNRPETHPVQPEWAPNPCCAYGVSKAASEAYLRQCAAASSLEIIVLRLGLTGWGIGGGGYRQQWLSDGDYARLIRAAVTTPADGFQCHFGVSANTPAQWDISSGREIGYVPVDDIARHPDPGADERSHASSCLLLAPGN